MVRWKMTFYICSSFMHYTATRLSLQLLLLLLILLLLPLLFPSACRSLDYGEDRVHFMFCFVFPAHLNGVLVQPQQRPP